MMTLTIHDPGKSGLRKVKVYDKTCEKATQEWYVISLHTIHAYSLHSYSLSYVFHYIFTIRSYLLKYTREKLQDYHCVLSYLEICMIFWDRILGQKEAYATL